jgi:hypothetical protein
MPGTAGPNLGVVWGYSVGENGWGTGGYNPSLARIDTLVQLAVLEVTNTPPGSPANGDRYIVGAAPTGAWAGQANKIAVWLTTGTPAWLFYTPKNGWRAWNADDSSWWLYDSSWAVDANATDSRFETAALAENDILVYDVSDAAFINVRPMRAISFGADPTALLTADQVVFLHRFGFPFTILADFADYRGASTTLGGTAVTTANTVFTVQKAATATPLTFADVGTLTVGIGTVNLTAKSSSAVDIVFAKGDVIRILAPTTPDATFKGIYGTLVGFES